MQPRKRDVRYLSFADPLESYDGKEECLFQYIDLLADLVVANYERFDIEGQRLLPLVKVYWPAE